MRIIRRFEKLIEKMVSWSNHYVMFDLKLADVDEHIVDRELASSGQDNKLYFNILALPKLLEFLKSLPGHENKLHPQMVL